MIQAHAAEKSALRSLSRWYPTAVHENDGALSIDWRFLGEHRFTEPFFQDTLTAAGSRARDSHRTPIEALSQFLSVDCVKPTAFVFHASRCGSTLITQLLASSDECIAISEAPAIDDALKLCLGPATRDAGLKVLSGVVGALGQRRFDEEKQLIVKLDSWHITSLPLIRRTFPDTPLFFLYREPSEIVSSHYRQRGSQMVPGLLDLEFLGLDSPTVDFADLDGYCRTVLCRLLEAAWRHAEAGDLTLIHYHQLPELIWGQFAHRLSIELDEDSIKSMQDRACRHSKSPGEIFTEESPPTGGEFVGSYRAALETAYEALERCRIAQNAW